jgi:protein O-mannosyl-transferase
LKREKNARQRHLKVAATQVPFVYRPVVRRSLPLAALLLVAFIAYSNSFHAPFLLDNEEIILKDPRVHALTSAQLHRILTQQYWETAPTGLYRPLTSLSYLFNYAILGNGSNPAGYHWINFLLHSMNIVLVYALGLAVFEQIPLALAMSAIWGLHPLMTEAVTNIVGRADLLAAGSVLGALWFHRVAQRTSGARQAICVAAIGLAVAAGMFAKESAIVVLAVLVLYDVAFQGGRSWRLCIAGYLAAAVPCAIYFYVRAQVLAGSPYLATAFTDNPLLQADFWTARMTALHVIVKYFGLLVWPAHLSYDYSYNQIPLFGSGGAANAGAVLGLVACVAAAIAIVLCWRCHRPVSFFLAFFFVTFAPVSNLVIVIGTIMGERLMYLPAVGLAGCVVYAASLCRSRVAAASPAWRNTALACMALLLLALAGRTYARNEDWVDPHRFWMSAVEAVPNSYKANLNAATTAVFVTQEDRDRAIRHADRALAILDGLPDSENAPDAYRSVGLFYRTVGERLTSQKSEAEDWYRKSLNALLRSERIEQVYEQQYRDENARRGKPGLTRLPSKLYLELGRTYMRLGDAQHAIAALERGRELESDPDLLEELASAYRAAGNPRQAALALVEAMAVDQTRTRLAGSLVDLYGEIDPNGCAVSREGGSRSLNVECPLVHGDICTASRNVIGTYRRRGQQFEADAIRRIAVTDLGCTMQ